MIYFPVHLFVRNDWKISRFPSKIRILRWFTVTADWTRVLLPSCGLTGETVNSLMFIYISNFPLPLPPLPGPGRPSDRTKSWWPRSDLRCGDVMRCGQHEICLPSSHLPLVSPQSGQPDIKRHGSNIKQDKTSWRDIVLNCSSSTVAQFYHPSRSVFAGLNSGRTLINCWQENLLG